MTVPDPEDARIQLVTRGDDAASFRAANRAIRDATADGILRNASVMAPGPELDHAAELLAGLDNLDIGVHLTLTAEYDDPAWEPILPAESVPSLVGEHGAFHADPGTLDEAGVVEEMVHEAEAQIKAVRDAGFDPVYLDAHMAVTWVQDLNEHIDALRRREGLLDGDAWRDGDPWQRGDPFPADFRCLPETDMGAESVTPSERLIRRLETAGRGTYLVLTHPCYPDDEIADIHFRDGTPAELASRDDDRQTVMAADIVEYCAEHGIEPMQFSDMERRQG